MKRHTLSLDLDDLEPDASGTAFLLFRSVAPNYAFVDDLNHLYSLALARTDDLSLGGAEWPLFAYTDALHGLRHHLVEMPAKAQTALWPAGHKLLIVSGDDAERRVAAIDDDFASPLPVAPAGDIIALERSERLAAMRAAFTTTLVVRPDQAPPPTATRRAAKEQNDLHALVRSIVDRIDLLRL